VIRKVKTTYPALTIIGSGDLMTARDIAGRMKEGGVDGVAIARGGIGNPWIYQEAAALLAGKDMPAPPNVAQQAKVLREHFEMVVRLYDETKVVAYFRKFIVHYTRRHPDRKKVMLDLLAVTTIEQVHRGIDKWYC